VSDIVCADYRASESDRVRHCGSGQRGWRNHIQSIRSNRPDRRDVWIPVRDRDWSTMRATSAPSSPLRRLLPAGAPRLDRADAQLWRGRRVVRASEIWAPL